jgi:hypothetical protein
MSNTTPQEKSEKINPQNKGRKIYVTKRAWYYENDPFDKEKVEAAKQLLVKLDFSQILNNADAGQQFRHEK